MEKGKERLFEVMGRLDKTFKPKMNEDIGDMGDDAMPDTGQAPDFQNMPEPTEMGDEEPVEQSPEEKLAELTAKVDELHAMIHGGEAEEAPAEEVPVEPEAGEEVSVDMENLQEWNFDKKKGDKEEKKEDKEHEDSESPKEEKEEHKDDLDEEIEAPAKPKVPVQAVAKVGEAK